MCTCVAAMCVQKFDIVRTTEEAETILGFVRDNAAKLLGTEPQVFPVSAYAAMQAKLKAAAHGSGGDGSPGAGSPGASGEAPRGVAAYSAPAAFTALENYVQTTLSDVEKVWRVVKGHARAAGVVSDVVYMVHATPQTRLKLESPLSVASKLCNDYLASVEAARATLHNDELVRSRPPTGVGCARSTPS